MRISLYETLKDQEGELESIGGVINEVAREVEGASDSITEIAREMNDFPSSDNVDDLIDIVSDWQSRLESIAKELYR